MGRVKLNFRPLYFIHGTPLEKSLGGAASHGCVRVANADAISLARLVHAAGTPSLPMALLDSLVADTSYTRFIVLDAPVPIVIRYDLAEVEADTLVLYRDVYAIEPRNEQHCFATRCANTARSRDR
jgi:murein L,D-transpeptidase YcbB/YkuD